MRVNAVKTNLYWLLLSLLFSGCASSILMMPDYSRLKNEPSDQDLAKWTVGGAPAQKLIATTSDGNRLVGFMFNPDAAKGTVIVGGGNAMSVSSTLKEYLYLVEAGYRVVAYSLRGYDVNEGDASLGTAIDDLSAFHRAVSERFSGEPIILVGSSLTATVTICAVESLESVEGMVIDSTLYLPRTYFTFLLNKPLLWPAYLVAPITALTTPGNLWTGGCARRVPEISVLVIHHPGDEKAPYSDGLLLFEKVPSKRKIFHTSTWGTFDNHITSLRSPEIRRIIEQFVGEVFEASAASAAEIPGAEQ